MKKLKFVIVVILTCMALMSLLAIGVCVGTAYVLYSVGDTRGAIALCGIALAFIVWQAWSVLKNKSEIIRDLKEVWNSTK